MLIEIMLVLHLRGITPWVRAAFIFYALHQSLFVVVFAIHPVFYCI